MPSEFLALAESLAHAEFPAHAESLVHTAESRLVTLGDMAGNPAYILLHIQSMRARKRVLAQTRELAQKRVLARPQRVEPKQNYTDS